jgi:hypothetical protein
VGEGAATQGDAVPYYMWFLTPERKAESCPQLIEFVAELGEGQHAKLTEGSSRSWKQISVSHADGSWAFDLNRSVVAKSKPGAQEIEFFRAGLEDAEPTVNAEWVARYLPRVKTVYTFCCSLGFSDTPTFGLVQDLIESFREDGPGGILYAELEGWSNENGQHITWEFSGRVTGKWWMAIRRDAGWTYFQMELGNRKHRDAFKAGKVPTGVKSETYSD